MILSIFAKFELSSQT